MNNLVEHIINKEYDKAENKLEESFHVILEKKMLEMKKKVAAKMEQNTPDERMRRLRMYVLEQEKYDPSTGTETKRFSSSSSIRLNKHGQEKAAHEPEEEGDETHMIRKSTTDSSGNSGSGSSSVARRIVQKVIRPDSKDGKGGDYDVSGSDEVERSSETETKKVNKDYVPGVTPVSEETDDEAPEMSRPGGIKIGGRTSSPGQQAFPTNPDYRERMSNIADIAGIATGIGPGRVKAAMTLGKIAAKFGGISSAQGQTMDEESGEESSMARSELKALTKDAKAIMSKIKGNKELEAWTQSKITKAADYMNAVADYMEDEGQIDEQRINIVKARIRGGVVQRRKRVSNVPGMTLRGGQLTRMSAAERRRRKLGAKKAARKSKQKKTQMLRKRKMSLMKRQRLGL